MSNPTDVPFQTTLLVRDTCLCLHLQRAARTLARRFDEALRPLGLTNQQFSLLMALNRPQPVQMAGLTQLLSMDRTTLTAALKPLQRRELVTVTVKTDDRRSREVTLSQEGRALLAQAVPIWASVHAGIEARMPPSGADSLRSSLQLLL